MNDDNELRQIKELLIAEKEYRQLGHRVVWDASGKCNVPGMGILEGEELKKQLERQRKYY